MRVCHPNTAYAVALVVMCAGCNLAEPAQRIETDPRLDEVTGESDANLGDTRDAGQEEDTEADVDNADTAEGDTPEAPLFVCQPNCQEGQFCAPDGLCYTPSSSCTTPMEVCDPNEAPPTPELVCEPVYGGEAGLCRAVCDTSQGNLCGAGQSCGRFAEGSTLSVCRSSCDVESDCHPLEHCGGAFLSPFTFCRGACKSFRGDQCPENEACLPEDPERGFCAGFGDRGELDPCNTADDRCAPEMACLNLGAGLRCHPLCASDVAPGASGSCEEDKECRQILDNGIGICAQRCDMFDDAQACPGGLGCSPLNNTRAGSCLPRGSKDQGQDCAATAECEGNLQCVIGVGDDGECLPLCVLGATLGEVGACGSGYACLPLEGEGELGFCSPR